MKILTNSEKKELAPLMAEAVEYRKSGLSLNHILGCPLDCAYCIRHIYSNYGMKKPQALMSDEEAVTELCSHQYFQPHRTPLQLFNRATDPFLPSVKPHTFRVLELLAQKGLTNTVLIITRWKVTQEDAELLNTFKPLRVVLLTTYSGIDSTRLEPVDSGIAAESLRTAYSQARNYRVLLYWRPLVPGVNDSDKHVEAAAALSKFAHATVFTGLFFRKEMREYFEFYKIPNPFADVARRKILPSELERSVLERFTRFGGKSIFRKTSCGVSFAYSLADYNGHYGIRELCDICPASQVARCRNSWQRPSDSDVLKFAEKIGVNGSFSVNERAVEYHGLSEQHRYFIQHALQFQVHDARHPHLLNQHGRAGPSVASEISLGNENE